MTKVAKFRRVKHADPEKLKVLVEDLPRKRWLERLSAVRFLLLLVVLMIAVFLVVAVGSTVIGS
jgi:hypothetical protein